MRAIRTVWASICPASARQRRSPGRNTLGADEVNRWGTRFEEAGGQRDLLSRRVHGIIGTFRKGIKRNRSILNAWEAAAIPLMSCMLSLASTQLKEHIR